MALLEKMRKRMGWFISIVIALALLAFIVDADTLQSAMSMFSSKYDVGKIGGKSISAQNYQKRLDSFTKIYEITTGNASTNEEVSEMINESAWKDAISDYVLMPACKNSGIGVGEDEMTDMCQGVDISPVLLSQGFTDAQGTFQKDAFLEFVGNIDKDASGNLKTYWNFLQDNMLKDRMFTKYTSLLQASDVVNALQLKRDIAENNTAYNVDFVMVPVPFTPDSTIVVSDSEIKSYYNKVKTALYQQESREADLVAFEIVPSEADIVKAKEDITALYPEFLAQESAADLKNFLYKNSDLIYEGDFYKKGDLASTSATLDDFVSTAAVGAVMEPVQSGNDYVAAKIISKALVPDSLFVKYLPAGSNVQVADSLINVLKKGESFAAVAAQAFPAEYIEQLQPGQELGEIGWVTPDAFSSSLPKEFKSLFTAKVGVPEKLMVNGNYLVTLVTKTSKPVQKAQAAILLKKAAASQDTYSKIYQEANSLVEKSGGKLEGFVEEANQRGLDIIPVANIAAGQKTLHNYNNMKEVSRWIYESKVGEVSKVFSVDNKYFFVAAVTKVNPQGFAPLSQVQNYIKTQLETEKKVEKLADEAKAAFGTEAYSLDEIAEKYNTSVSSQNGITFSSVQSYGQLDPAFIGAVAAAGQKGETKVVGPVKGSLGIVYFKINDKETGAYYSESDAENRRQQIAASLMSILPQLMLQDSNTQDNRYKFY